MCTADKRHFSLTYTKCRLPNGTEAERDWIIFSPSLQGVLCFVCKLFGVTNQHPNAQTFRTTAYNDWKNCIRSFDVHERSRSHLAAYLAYRTRAMQTATLDSGFLRQQEIEIKYWRELLRRVVSVIKFLAARGLAFRGSDQRLGSHSNGNYLGIIELLAEHDTFLATHIAKYGNKGTGEYSFFFYLYHLHLTGWK